MLIALSIVLAAFPLGVCYAARAWLGRDFLQAPWVFPALFVAGALGGLLFGVFLSPSLEPWFVGFDGIVERRFLLTTLVNPLAEELGKGLVLLAFLPTRWFRSPVDGLLYGLAAGAGFATVENVLYFASAYGDGGDADLAQTILVRLPAALLVHGGGTAILGGYLGVARWAHRPLVVFGALPAALFLATAIHGGWNALVEFGITQRSQEHLFAALALLGVVSSGLVLALWASLRLEAADLRAELRGEIGAGLLTGAEVEALAARRVVFRRRRAASPGERRRFLRSARSPQESLEAAMVELAFALRRARLEGRGLGELEVLRERVRAAREARRASRDLSEARPDAGLG